MLVHTAFALFTFIIGYALGRKHMALDLTFIRNAVARVGSAADAAIARITAPSPDQDAVDALAQEVDEIAAALEGALQPEPEA